MLSYRHSFHAGNPADVIKHLVLADVLKYMTKKDKPFEYIDTHSGAGIYQLGSDEAQKTQEYEQGIARLWHYNGQDQTIHDYLELVRSLNPVHLSVYPGSPSVAQHILRPQDRAWLFELHPRDFEFVEKHFARSRNFRIRQEDGFKGLLGLVPPQSRRACVLIDPPYEIKKDYDLAVDAVIKAHRRFATGTYMIWYPVVDRERIDRMEKRLVDSGMKNIQLYELATEPDKEERGMTASGMMVVNPPWQLKNKMDTLLPDLVKMIAPETGNYRSIQLVDE